MYSTWISAQCYVAVWMGGGLGENEYVHVSLSPFTSSPETIAALLMGLCVLGHFSRFQLFVTPWTVAHPAPLFTGFSRQEYWSELLCLPPGNLPDSGIKPTSPVAPAWQADSLSLSHQGSL